MCDFSNESKECKNLIKGQPSCLITLALCPLPDSCKTISRNESNFSFCSSYLRDSLNIIATGYGLNGPGIESR